MGRGEDQAAFCRCGRGARAIEICGAANADAFLAPARGRLGVGPAIGEHRHQRRGGEKVNARQHARFRIARRIDVEDHQREHHHVGHRVAPDPFHRRDRFLAEIGRHVVRGDERQQIEQLQEREEYGDRENDAAQEVFFVLGQRVHDRQDRVLVRPDVNRREADRRQNDAEREEYRCENDQKAQREIAPAAGFAAWPTSGSGSTGTSSGAAAMPSVRIQA